MKIQHFFLVFYEPNKKNCHDLQIRKNGVYKFASEHETPNEAGRFFDEKYCDFNTNGPAWTVIQRRVISEDQENFNRSWMDYKFGFGDLNKEFWFGNEFIHNLTCDEDMELRIILELNGRKEWAEYSFFRVEAEDDNYNLMIDGFRGSIPDFLINSNDQDFITYDRPNDNFDSYQYDRPRGGSGWWHTK